MSTISILALTVVVVVYQVNAAALHGYGHGPYGFNYKDYGTGYNGKYGAGYNKESSSEYGSYKYGGSGRYGSGSEYGSSYGHDDELGYNGVDHKDYSTPFSYGHGHGYGHPFVYIPSKHYGTPSYGYTPTYGYGYNKQPAHGAYNFGPHY